MTAAGISPVPLEPGDLELGSHHEVEIDGITSEGAGVGRLAEGRAVFVHRTAPGDRVLVEITSAHKRWARARLVELRRPGPNRRDPPCPYYQWCGGCTLEHLTYASQLRLKARLVSEALVRIGKRAALPKATMTPAPRETRYRNRITVTLIRGNDGDVTAGFHRLEDPGSIVDVDRGCLLPEEPIAATWDRLRASWGPGAARLPGGSKLSLTLRLVGGEDVLLLLEGGRGRGDPEGLLSDVHGLSSIWHRKEGSESPPRLVAGRAGLTELWHGEEMEVGPTAFVQVNRGAAEELHRYVIDEVGPASGKRAVDAYCGFGAFGRRLARDGADVVGIEADPEAVEMSTGRPVSGFRLLHGRVEELLPSLLPADLVIVNPPRAGVRPEVAHALQRAGPPRLIYVSCDPATLARDVARLQAYGIAQMGIFDFFPQTAHVETVLTLERV